MTDLWFYLNRLRGFAGIRLYTQLAAMIAVGLFDGVGIYLLAPLLGLLGFFGGSSGSIPLAAGWLDALRSLNVAAALPVLLGVYVLVMAIQALLQKEQSIRGAQLQQGFIRHLRLRIYEGLMRSNWLFFVRRRRSDFHHVLTSELARVSQATYLLMQLASSLAFTVIQIAFAFWLSAKLTAFVLISGAAIALAMRRRIRRAKAVGNQTSLLSQSYYAGLTDHLGGIKEIKSNRLEAFYLDWFRSLTGRMEANFTAFSRLQAVTECLYRIAAAALIALFVYLSYEVFRVAPGQLMLIVIIFARLWPRFTAVQSNAEQIYSAIPAIRSLRQLERECEAARESADDEGTGIPRAMPVKQGIECSGVFFRYGEDEQSEYALKDINARIPAGKMTAIIGKSGAGKSTLVDILMGLLEPVRGTVLIDGVPLGEDTRNLLRHSVGYVAQDPFLFHASIRENLQAVRPDAREEELWEALRFSASDDFVRRLPEGLDTIVGDRGVRLSGGERQRLVLARAMLRRPSILVLDEATSALDNENEARIQEAIDRLKGTMTIIVIAHRLSTIRNADQVLVLERGEVVREEDQQLAK
ncbi:ABC transporter ATP-binding protein [Cohnella zeiphila]|uniref:ABC transporter ATP-binding protein n=1 Tax=Cohnella zeiphila TaxID=2761120 RepID=A0A7X0VYW2_9BACL|nr:ABC transporter ATP-binding protein [Cohnella zeiphila]MBB6735130.1 ABC transporter ATP-binding protein [Cohnella zeiphila]